MRIHKIMFLVLMSLFLVFSGFAQSPGGSFDLTLLHVGDTHSKLEPSQTALKLDIDSSLKAKTVYVELGGFPRLISQLTAERASNRNILFLHAGDAFQGTLYFTQFLGKADVDFLNLARVDAMVLGNHEFDKGPQVLRDSLLANAQFSILSANMNYGAETLLKGAKILPYVIKTVGGAKIAIIGATLPDTVHISSPGKNIHFDSITASVTAIVNAVEAQGINKIIVLSHQGYEEDLELAKKVAGIDVIVGGHSHTLLGDMASLGLASKGSYPTVVTGPRRDNVLVVHAWEWEKILGELKLTFNSAGVITKWSGVPRLLVGDSWFRIYDLPGADSKPVRVEFTRDGENWKVMESDGKAYIVAPPADRVASHLKVLATLLAGLKMDQRVAVVKDDPDAAKKLAGYSSSVASLKAKVACEAKEPLKRMNNQGPGPVIADAMLWKTGADIAVMNPGGVRMDMNPGPVSVAQVYELQPFGNTLVTLTVSGEQVLKVLEDMTDYCITSYKPQTTDVALIYVAGVKFKLTISAPKGSRVTGVMVGKPGAYSALEMTKKYKMVVNSFMAGGGDKNETLKSLANTHYDTGFVDSEASLEYLQGKTLSNLQEERVMTTK